MLKLYSKSNITKFFQGCYEPDYSWKTPWVLLNKGDFTDNVYFTKNSSTITKLLHETFK